MQQPRTTHSHIAAVLALAMIVALRAPPAAATATVNTKLSPAAVTDVRPPPVYGAVVPSTARAHLQPPPPATGRQAFFIFFASMLRGDDWPHGFRQYRNGAVILDPSNATAADVSTLRRELNVTVLLYWDFGDIRSMQWAHGAGAVQVLEAGGPAAFPGGGPCSGVSCCDHIKCSPRGRYLLPAPARTELHGLRSAVPRNACAKPLVP